MRVVKLCGAGVVVALALFGALAVVGTVRELVVDLQFLHLARVQQEQQVRQQQARPPQPPAPQKDPANEPR